jgi:hypothetical protein
MYAPWLITMLDAQTNWWKDMERQTANLMQVWLGPTAPAPSAQWLVDAMQGRYLLGPAALQRAWTEWAQLWANALQHDASES